jgi:hypothetical protein
VVIAGVAFVVFGVLQLVFRGAFGSADMALHRRIQRRVPWVYEIPGMRHRVDADGQVVSTVIFAAVCIAIGVVVIVAAL